MDDVRDRVVAMKKRGLVYSTDKGRICADCGQASAACNCRNNRVEKRPPSDGVVRLSRESKGRKGSGVTLISGLSLAKPDLKKIAKGLKKKCGAGGAVKNGVIEIQGDHRELLLDLLAKLGYKAKLAGG